MVDTKISDDPAATDLLSAIIPIVQGGLNKQASIDLFNKSGTWTPEVAFGGLSVGVTYSRQDGWYLKLGSLVILFGRLTLTSKGSSVGAATVKTAPFTNTTRGWGGLGQQANFVGLTGALSIYMSQSSTSLEMRQSSATGSANITDTNFANNTDFMFFAAFSVQ